MVGIIVNDYTQWKGQLPQVFPSGHYLVVASTYSDNITATDGLTFAFTAHLATFPTTFSADFPTAIYISPNNVYVEAGPYTIG